MSRVWLRLKRGIYLLELYEIVGITVMGVVACVFLKYSQRIDLIFGVTGYHWRLINNMVGIVQNLTTWLFTFGLLLLVTLYSWLNKSEHAKVRQFAVGVRASIAFFLVMAVYKTVIFYISVLNPVDHDIILKHIDRALFFGRLPSEWLEPLIWRPLTWLLSLCYASWFALVYFTIFLMLSRSEQALREYVFTAVITFYIGYLTYVFVPAIGPIFTVHYDRPIGGITNVLTLGQAVLSRDCFPSLHTGISIVMLVEVWRHRRRWCWLYIPLVTLIIFSTLYLRIHYGIDVIAGAALAITTTQLAPLVLSAWEHARRAPATMYAPTGTRQTVSAESVSELA
jgi:membrane-associated phospholipid phosphatase